MEPQCWCGSEQLAPFSEDYLRCGTCETLVAIRRPQSRSPGEGLGAFYGLGYWFEGQQSHGDPDITYRARHDLVERCPFWLRALLRYKLPPASVLELGCSHGAFTFLLRQAGFDARGLELNPEVAGLAAQTFQIPVLTGPLESQGLEAASLDAIVLMDVLEHLPDPAGTMRACLELLKPDGILVIQTPCYPEGKSLADLAGQKHAFMKMLLPGEHLFLFSEKSVKMLLERSGAENLCFEPAFFSLHDMFLFASKAPFTSHSTEAIEKCLTASPDRRLALALLDLEPHIAEIEADRTARLEMIIKLNSLLAESQKKNQQYESILDHGSVRFLRRLLKF